jgi:hypothetical protein
MRAGELKAKGTVSDESRVCVAFSLLDGCFADAICSIRTSISCRDESTNSKLERAQTTQANLLLELTL